jgi:hypothetical protein
MTKHHNLAGAAAAGEATRFAHITGYAQSLYPMQICCDVSHSTGS